MRRRRSDKRYTVTTQRVVLYLESLIKRSPVQWNWLTVRVINYKDAVLGALKMI